MKCPTCQSEIAAGARFCSACGGAIAGEDSETVVATPRSDPNSGGERLVPGIVLAERYRIVGRLGRGGMGEVYRADDLKLGQPVALKFLPEGLENDPRRLEMLLEEVRVARGVSHPNLCRVYDVGEAGGHHFICMEYVDGENLETLLRRIGRLAGDKASQIARQICAGLAALHEQGLIHRDLKPANVMIDGRGRARITDFGLARPAASVEGRAARDGTPAYMAPEQLAGREATARSDVYALGLVLYELFTGRRPFAEARSIEEALDERTSGLPTSPSSHVAELEPAVERAIQRCLDPDPERRHASALGVAAALPGGDPLGAALAAGETPSPELIAAAPTEGTVAPALAWGAVLFTLLGVVAGLYLMHRTMVAPEGLPPIVLADRARAALAELGYPVTAGDDEGWGYLQSRASRDRMREDPAAVGAMTRGEAPPLFVFWYRAAPGTLMPDRGILLQADDPPLTEPGSARVLLRTDGTLLELETRPAEIDGPPQAAADWATALRLAGLDVSLEEVPPEPLHALGAGTEAPPLFLDRRVAWRGRYPAGMEMRVEGGSVGGEVAWFRVFDPESGGLLERADLPPVFFVLLATLFGGIIVSGIVLARRNLRNGRGDRRGAVRVALLVGGMALLGDLLIATHGLAVAEFATIWTALSANLLVATLTGIFYLGLEPLLRRNWPHRIVAWTRALDGRWRDPLVGRELLAAAVGSVVFTFGASACLAAARALGWTETLTEMTTVVHLGWGVRGILSAWPTALGFGTTLALGFTVLVFVLVRIVRSVPLGGAMFVVVMLFGLTVRSGWDDPLTIAIFAIPPATIALVLLRFGLLAFATHLFLNHLWILYPAAKTSDAWYAGSGPVLMSTLVVVAAYGAWLCTRRTEPGVIT